LECGAFPPLLFFGLVLALQPIESSYCERCIPVSAAKNKKRETKAAEKRRTPN
jgi:hypothetical protein